jgi:acetyl esterase/lipase
MFLRCGTLTLVLAITGVSSAQERPAVVLWPKEVPGPAVQSAKPERVEKAPDGSGRRFDVSQPRLFVFEPAADKRNGVGVIVVPGGGFGRLADTHEGSDACLWLSGLGITSFLLVHRCPTDKHADPAAGPLLDAQRAVQLVRERAADWKIEPAKVGLFGFSAGGQVAARATANAWQGPPEAAAVSHKPDFLLLLYPWRIYDDKTRGLRADLKVEAGFPPTFLAQCGDDKGSLPQGSTLLYLELINHQVPAELHIYERGGHGFGMQSRPGATGPSDWPQRAADWLRVRGLAK